MRAKVLVYHNAALVAKLRFQAEEAMNDEEFRLFVAEESRNRTSVNDWHKEGIALGEARNGCRPTTDGDLIVVRIGNTMTTYKVDENGIRAN